MNSNTKLLLTTFVTMALFTFSASAATHSFTYTIDHGQAGTIGVASGSGTATYDDVTGYFTWNYSFMGLSGAATSAHFHGAAAAGATAPPVVTVPSPDTTPNIGMIMISRQQGLDLIQGLWYLNIHTAMFPGGEIRGQLINDNPFLNSVDNLTLIASLEKKIKKLKKKAKAAGKKGNLKTAKKLKKKTKKLQKTVSALS